MDRITEYYFDVLCGYTYFLSLGGADKVTGERLAKHMDKTLENLKMHLESILRNTDD
jgi:hypothetical protein